ncbi:PepSY domain-containing protein [Rhodoblastus acidophilus]|uniref:PepSY domain-containing protein n=1 Tax=Candidatus Rhodoblastus alkanivorans TaxID=2954117 RepID=A0ABS9Z3G9_9HYPH|nr:PepSY domain-containing protein [Candidatus Rhodoblastus alkanivorans]MCI4679752.1 PepSY domain-containing protein [Candidatus Rhodoblastus alkanivorans]MCI4681990.1 PepSY domain-containing protein [Candidatus Rhodoblastus alkanivorans]MDI4643041.1 PepSY domain-containing protein [Rhodoblastus acidophilus]
MSRAHPALFALALFALPLFPAAPVPAAAEAGRPDQDDARAAVEKGAILPLETILVRLKGRLPGEIVKVKLEHERGVWVYEFRVIDGQGSLREIEVDAATGEVTNEGDH